MAPSSLEMSEKRPLPQTNSMSIDQLALVPSRQAVNNVLDDASIRSKLEALRSAIKAGHTKAAIQCCDSCTVLDLNVG